MVCYGKSSELKIKLMQSDKFQIAALSKGTFLEQAKQYPIF